MGASIRGRERRFADGWAPYGLDDFPERHSPERVREVLAYASASDGDGVS